MMLAVMVASQSPAYAAAEAERLLKQDIDRREQERRNRRWEESHAPGSLPATPPEKEARPPAAVGPCFPLQKITLHPTDILDASRVENILAVWQGRCLHAQDLADIQQALNSEALAAGLVTTRVVVPEQNLASGELRLEVWPGRVEDLRAFSLSHMELAFASPARPGDLLQLRALEQAVDNLNRLSSFQAALELQPGTQAGGTVVDFSVARARPWQAGVAWQSEALNGSEATNNLRANLTLDSPLKLSDRLTLGLNSNLKDMQVDAANGGNIDYDLPFGWWRLSFGADRFDYENELTAGVTHFRATGESRAWRAELSRNVHRDAHNRFGMALHLKQRISDNYIDGVTIGVSSYRVEATGLRMDFSRVSAPWIWDATLDAEQGAATSPARVSPYDSRYTRVLGSTRLQYQFERISLSAAANAQWTSSQLAVSEQFTLAGQVPGFAPLSLNSDNGVSAKMEAAWPFRWQRAGFTQIRPTLALNWATAPDTGATLERQQLASVSTGLVAPWRKAVAQIGVALPLANSDIESPQSWQLDASLSLQW